VTPTRRRRAAVLGGTFDPIHTGHLAVIDQVRRAVDADEAWLIPAARSPHRRPTHAGVEDRLAMTRAAAEGLSGVRVLDVEVRRDGLSYTVDTLDELERTHPEVTPWFTLGADAAREVGSWHRAGELLARAHFVVVNRTGVPPIDEEEARRLGFDPVRTLLIHVASPLVSATEIRERVAAGEPIAGLVPPAVARIIAERKLYVSSADGVG
jgi:nicotinate-nucleotide adenylyltransferase